jgi:hypothetical protein
MGLSGSLWVLELRDEVRDRQTFRRLSNTQTMRNGPRGHLVPNSAEYLRGLLTATTTPLL